MAKLIKDITGLDISQAVKLSNDWIKQISKQNNGVLPFGLAADYIIETKFDSFNIFRLDCYIRGLDEFHCTVPYNRDDIWDADREKVEDQIVLMITHRLIKLIKDVLRAKSEVELTEQIIRIWNLTHDKADHVWRAVIEETKGHNPNGYIMLDYAITGGLYHMKPYEYYIKGQYATPKDTALAYLTELAERIEG